MRYDLIAMLPPPPAPSFRAARWRVRAAMLAIAWLAVFATAGTLHSAPLDLPENIETHPDGRLPIEILYEKYLSLVDKGWILDIVAPSKPEGRAYPLPIIALRTPRAGEATWIFSGIHGEEPAGPNAIAAAIDDLAKLGEHQAVVLLPLNNPHGYANNWRYLNMPVYSETEDGHSVGDSSHLLPDPANPDSARAAAASSPEVDAITRYVLNVAGDYPPAISLDLHEDTLIHEGYVYSQGQLGAGDALAQAAVGVLKGNGIPLKMSGETRFGESIQDGIIGPVVDSSIDELMSAASIIVDGRTRPGPAARTVLVFETPAGAIELQRRIDAHAALLRELARSIESGPPNLQVSAFGQERDRVEVLILDSYDENSAPYTVANEVFIRDLQERHPRSITFRQFNLKVGNEDTPEQEEQRIQTLQGLLAESGADLVLAISPPAIRFWLAHRDSLAPDALFVAMAAEFFINNFDFRPGDATVASRSSYADALDNILGLLPQTKSVVMVFGSSAFERALANKAREELSGYGRGIDLEYTSDLPLEALQEKLAALPAHTAVLYVVLENDVNQVNFRQYTGLKLVRAASNSPVFGIYDDLLGQGIVGGRLIQVEGIRSAIAATVDASLRQKPAGVVRNVIGLSEPTYDWREIQAWHIDTSRLPPGSVIRFRPPSLWEKYAVWIVLGALIIIAQVPILASVLRKNRQWRKAEAMRTELASRLITAHEDERRALARELHDDLSQRLARLAIDTSYVITHPGTAAANSVMEGLHPELVRISKDVHDMSYRLHPSLIDDLGLGTALGTECERARRLTDAKISQRIGPITEDIPHDKLLSVFRIAQESLHNAIRHARARNISVVLDDTGKDLVLTVHDDGVGFDPGVERGKPSLGLLSMSERAQLAGGALTISSQPGKGATVRVAVPHVAVAP